MVRRCEGGCVRLEARGELVVVCDAEAKQNEYVCALNSEGLWLGREVGGSGKDDGKGSGALVMKGRKGLITGGAAVGLQLNGVACRDG